MNFFQKRIFILALSFVVLFGFCFFILLYQHKIDLPESVKAQVSATAYYMRADGTAADKASATSCSSASTAMSVVTHNTQSFFPGDTIFLCDDGGDYKSSIVVSSSGTSGNPITYANAPGDTPVIDLSVNVGDLGWTDAGNGIFTKSGYGRLFWEDGVPLKPATSTSFSDGNWYYPTSTGKLYYKPVSGTPLGHSIRTLWFPSNGLDLSNQSYITVYGLTFNRCGYGIYHGDSSSSPAASIAGITIHHNNFKLCYWAIFGDLKMSSAIESDVSIFNNNIDYCNSGISAWTNSDSSVGHSQHHIRYAITYNNITHLADLDDSHIWNDGLLTSYYWTDHEAISFQDVQDSVIAHNLISTGYSKIFTNSDWWNRAIYFYLTNGVATTSGNSIYNNYVFGHFYPAFYVSSAAGNPGFENNNYNSNILVYDGTYGPHMAFKTYFNPGFNPAQGTNNFCNNTIYNAIKYPGIFLSSAKSAGKWNFFGNSLYNASVGFYYGPYSNHDASLNHNIYYPGLGVWAIQGTSGGGINPVSWTTWQNNGFDVDSVVIDPLFVNDGNYSSSYDFTPLWNSPVIDAGTDVGLTQDYFSNPIYGTPDIGAIEYQPPYTMGTNKPDISANIRIYGDGKFRNKSNPTGTTANLSIIPSSGNTRQYMDIAFQTWDASTTTKKWTESSDNLGSTITNHTIGDLTSSKSYSVYYTKANETRIKLDTKTANFQGQIIFNYDKGYSEVIFEIEEDTSSVSTPNETIAPNPSPTSSSVPSPSNSSANPAGGSNASNSSTNSNTNPISNSLPSSSSSPTPSASISPAPSPVSSPVPSPAPNLSHKLLSFLGKVYKIIDTKRMWIPSPQAFNSQGLNWNDIQTVNQESDITQYKRAHLLKTSNDPRVYYITEGGLKRHILNEKVFLSYNNHWEDIMVVTQEELNSYPDSTLIRQQGDPMVYLINQQTKTKQWIKSPEEFNKLKLDWKQIAPVNEVEMGAWGEN